MQNIITLFCLLLSISFSSLAQTVNAEYLNPTFGNGNPYSFIRFGTSQDYKAGFMWNNNDAYYGNGNDFSIFTYNDRDLTFYTGQGNIIMFPSNGGNVGIGTTNPQGKVDIKKGSQNLRLLTGSNTSGYNLNIGVNDDGVNFTNSSRIRGYLFGNANGTLLTINSQGNVGIGTRAPDAKLTVKGNIHAQEVKVDLAGAVAPDYVFLKDYQLKTLDEVDSYIQVNGHLPNIPSAAIMEKEGVKLKEMNLKLLEKIEELTLYTIEQEKAIQELIKEKDLNTAQNKKIQKLEQELQKLISNSKKV
ncbi:tail fiber protein [Aquimarina sp. W85]|uniref:tail fiber protein n=1 Tax=Aquimarina rhodophyticola TaxID=3342246 RepID=UPI00366E7ADB